MGGVIKLEFRRNVSGVGIFALITFVLLSTIILQIGMEKYKVELKRKAEFVKVEKRKIERYINYQQYGGYGFRRLLVSNPLISLFYNSSTLSDLQVFIDNAVRLKFSKSYVGANLFEKPTGGSLDFSWFLLIIGSMFVFIWSFFAFRNLGYLKFLMSIFSKKNVFAGIIVSRILLLLISLAITFCIACIQFFLNGIRLTLDDISNLLIFLLISVLILVFFQIFGSLFGTFKNWKRGAFFSVIFWIVVVLAWPEGLNVTIARIAADNMKSTYLHEIQKIERLMEFEDEALKESKRYNTKSEKEESDRKMAERYWNDDSKEIRKVESKMIGDTEKSIRRFHFMSIFNPITFFKCVNNELSSKGFNAFSGFYRECQDIQRGFLRYYIDNRYYEDYTKVKPYLDRGENVVISNSSLPGYFFIGLAICFIYLIFGLLLLYHRFKKFFTEEPGELRDLDLDIKPGRLNFLLTGNQGLKNQVYNFFSGKGKTFVKISVDAESLENEGKGCVYLFDTKKMPEDITPPVLHKLLFGTKLEGEMKKWEILFKFALIEAEKGKVILMDDFMNELKESEIKNMKQEIQSRGLTVLYMSNRFFFGLQVADEPFIYHTDDSSVEPPKNSRNK